MVNYNLTIRKGSEFSEEITILDSNKNPISLDGYTAEMKIKSNNRSNATLVVELNSANNRINITGTSGLITLLLSSSETAAITYKGVGLYDLELVQGSSRKQILSGTVSFIENITI